KTVMGDPITVGDVTIVPLRSAGFWFGTGGGQGGDKTKSEGTGAGTGGAGGVKPVAVLIIDKNGVRIEPMKGSLAQMAEKVSEAIPKMSGAWKGKGKDSSESAGSAEG
ncbi:MAG: sporulation protein YtfJ, partial [Dehalococcoidia bacterium]|nr:sporulation protein YtfJ [Dehalococcoidia bacterium]